jgi:hypothetical protein
MAAKRGDGAQEQDAPVGGVDGEIEALLSLAAYSYEHPGIHFRNSPVRKKGWAF